MEAEAEALGEGGYFFTVYDDIGVDYSFSPSPIFIDLEKNPQQGGFAQGDTLLVGSLDTSAPVPGMFEIVGSLFDDVIRGSDEVPEGAIFNNPGDQVLDGGP